MDIPQEYLTPAGFGEAELVEKRSRFIARVWPVPSEAEALACIADMRRQHRDATHNVFAYIIKGGPTRCSDDGEPQGTSGQPTLNVFQSETIENVCCVVTRHYGGTPLGAGGLVRAYSRAAKLALDKAGITVNKNTVPFETRSPFVTSGVRIGTAALTTRGFTEADMEKVVTWIDAAIKAVGNETRLDEIRKEVEPFAKSFPLFAY